MIGIINMQWFDNPGAVLLAYALQKTVQDLKPDEEVVIIDYAAGGARRETGSSGNLLLKKIARKFRSGVSYLSPSERTFKKGLKHRQRNFEIFREDHLNRTPRFSSINSTELARPFSACIVGSDVVWKPEIAQEIDSEIYFLRFLPDRVRKIAYAASIGTDDSLVLKTLQTRYSELLSDFDCISVREKTAAEFLRPLTQKDVTQVLDPVFLLDAQCYTSLIQKMPAPTQEPYLYVYMLSYNEHLVQFAKEIAEKRNCKIIFDLHTKANLSLKTVFASRGIPSTDAGPMEFLNLIYHADMVLCDSFHGTAFSILFHKDFYTFGNRNGGIDISARMRDLLELLSLQDRYLCSQAQEKKAIDYTQADEKLEKLRRHSLEYLQQALSDTQSKQ